ncbi:MAG: FtsK/SpoIIIE domain-containing protein [Acidimicrobiia bacterium]
MIPAPVIGVVDNPELQRRDALTVNLRDALTVIIGARGSGKTEAVRTLITALWQSPDADAFDVLIIADDPSKYASLCELPLVLTVADTRDDERTERIVNFATSDASDASSNRRRLLIIDRWNGFAQRDVDLRNSTCTERIFALLANSAKDPTSVIVTADRPNAFPYSMMSACPTPIVLRLDEPEDYRSIGMDPRKLPAAMAPGRCVIGTQYAQIARTSDASINARRHGNPGGRSEPVGLRTLPQRIRCAPLPVARNTGTPAINFAVDVATFDTRRISPDRTMLICGPPQSGKSNALALLARSGNAEEAIHVLCAAHPTAVLAARQWDASAVGDAPVLHVLTEITTALGRGQPARPIRLFIDDYGAFLEAAIDDQLELLISMSARVPIALTVTADHVRMRQTFSAFGSRIRAQRHALLLSPEHDDGDIAAATLPRRLLASTRPGHGVLVDRASVNEVLVFDISSQIGAPARL